MSNAVNLRRRRLLGTTIASIGVLDLGLAELVHAQPAPSPPNTSNALSGGQTSPFGTLHQIDAGVLNIGYADLGPKNGPAVILLHGWPYDIYSYAEVAPALAASREELAICSGVTGIAGCLPTVSPAPVTAQVMMILGCMESS